jgi:hypothetical protein
MDPRLREDDEAAGIPGQPGRGAEGASFSQAARSSHRHTVNTRPSSVLCLFQWATV